ncbi:MAG TPA: hypothetical protein G4O00_07315 [Thermoflexia bacterium]|jgi:hypothetical protein|nr:hypothetical protein [Thermoflexia bacterium]
MNDNALQIGLTPKDLQTVIEALEAYADAVYRSNSDVEYKHTKGEEIWRLREQLRKTLVGADGSENAARGGSEWTW